MGTLKERSVGFGVDDNGDVVPLEDYQERPVANESIVQGITNLETHRSEQEWLEQAEIEDRHMREQSIANTALASAGVYIPLSELTQTKLGILDAVSQMSMYRGGEKGGYQSKDFRSRYGESSGTVEGGARQNHLNLVNKVFPELLKASQLVEVGFEKHDVNDMVNTMRMEIMDQYGGPDKEKARKALRARLKRQ